MRLIRAAILATLATASFSACAPSPKSPVMNFEQFAELDSQIRAVSIAATNSCKDGCQKLRQEFRYVVYIGKQIYAYWDQKKAETGTDFDALATTLENSIVQSTTPTEYFLILRRWASAFHDGHVNAMLKSNLSDIEVYTTPVRFEILAPGTDHEKVLIAAVASTHDSAEEMPQAGDQVLSIDGKAIGEVLDEAETMASGSTRRMRRFSATRRLSDTLGAAQGGAPLTLTVLRKDETAPRELTLFRTAELMPSRPNQSGDSAPSTGVENFKALILPGNLGYLRIDAFMGSQSGLLLDQAMRRLSRTAGLLIDVRKNGGGDQSGNAILAHMIRTKITRYRTSVNLSPFLISQRPEAFFLKHTEGATFTEWNNEEVLPAQNAVYLDKPVMALTSANCFSACDTFVAALKSNGLAKVVGEGTGGGTGTPLVFNLPHSSHLFRYSVVRGLTSNGDAIEGAGTLPDVVIEPTLEERLAKKDQQLLTALALLQQKVTPPTTPVPPVNPANMTSTLSTAVNALGDIWAQDMTLSPTLAEEFALARIAPMDELN